jgi:hypothetical protein
MRVHQLLRNQDTLFGRLGRRLLAAGLTLAVLAATSPAVLAQAGGVGGGAGAGGAGAGAGASGGAAAGAGATGGTGAATGAGGIGATGTSGVSPTGQVPTGTNAVPNSNAGPSVPSAGPSGLTFGPNSPRRNVPTNINNGGAGIYAPGGVGTQTPTNGVNSGMNGAGNVNAGRSGTTPTNSNANPNGTNSSLQPNTSGPGNRYGNIGRAAVGTNAGGTGPNTFSGTNPAAGSGANSVAPDGTGIVGAPGTTGTAATLDAQAGANAQTSGATTQPTADQVQALNNTLRASPLGIAVDSSTGNGLTLTSLNQGAVAQRAGLTVGDQLFSLNGRPISSQQDLITAMQGVGGVGGLTAVGIRRGGQVHTIHVDLSAGPGFFSGNATTGGATNSAIASGANPFPPGTAVNSTMINNANGPTARPTTPSASTPVGNANGSGTANPIPTGTPATGNTQTGNGQTGTFGQPNATNPNPAVGNPFQGGTRTDTGVSTGQGSATSNFNPDGTNNAAGTSPTAIANPTPNLSGRGIGGLGNPGGTAATTNSATGTSSGATTGTAGIGAGTTTSTGVATGIGATNSGTTTSAATGATGSAATGTQAVSTPAVGTPAVGTPAVGTPATGTDGASATPTGVIPSTAVQNFDRFSGDLRTALNGATGDFRTELTRFNNGLGTLRSDLVAPPNETAADARLRNDRARFQLNALRSQLDNTGTTATAAERAQLEALRTQLNGMFQNSPSAP